MDIVSLSKKINDLNKEIEYLNSEINKIIKNDFYTEEEKKEYIANIKDRITKKERSLDKYNNELNQLKNDHNTVMINILKDKALKSLSGLVSDEQYANYQAILSDINELDKIKPIIDSINNIVRNDYISKITNIESYDPNSRYRLLCHSISTNVVDFDNDYMGDYISCSVLSNEQNDTYSSNFGLIYSPESIVSAYSDDSATYNYANNNENLLTTQLYPTIQNIDSVIKETADRKKESNGKAYNEVVIKKTEPIGIFYKGDYDKLDQITKTMIDKLRMKYPNLKVIGIPNSTRSIEQNMNIIRHTKADELNELEKKKQLAKQNNDESTYNYVNQCIEKIIRENRMQVTPEQWNSYTSEQKESYIQIKMQEARVLNDKNEFNYWLTLLNSIKQGNNVKVENTQKSTLEELKNSIGKTDGYTFFVHGTHLTDEEVKKLIFKEGLRTTGTNEKTSLNYTTKPLDIASYSIEELRNKLENYDHNNRNMIIIKLPNEYFNIYDTTADRDCRASRAFMKKKIMVDGGYKYVLDPKFIVGSYNTETKEATLNNSFERELSNETRNTLEANLKSLHNELGIQPELIESLNSNDTTNKSSTNNVKDYNYYFDEMVKAIQRYNPNEQMTEQKKKELIGEIFYNETYLTELISNDEEIRQVMNRSINELNGNKIQTRLQNIILTELQEKYKKLHPENKQNEQLRQEKNMSNNSSTNNDKLDLSGMISQLKMELTKVQNLYHLMMSDGYIDDIELAKLLKMINEIINNGYSLKSLATDPSDLKVISVIISSLEDEQTKMNRMQNGIKEIGKIIR